MAVPAPIAVVGMSCRFPGAGSPEELEELLLNGGTGWGPIPSDRWNRDAYYNTHLGAPESLVAKNGYFLQDDISKFDARFFQVPPKEAHAMDPQQRILLQTTYEALENAGVPLEDIRGSKTAVFISSFAYDYQRMGYKDLAEVSGSHVAGTGMAMLSNRISYVFDLRGPSLTLDTGCVSSPPTKRLFLLPLGDWRDGLEASPVAPLSGSLVCLHQACQSLRLGESNMAIVGGSQLLIDPAQSVNMSVIGMVNPDGHCYAFDSRGNGYARGEGVATVVLKLLDKALEDGDPIHGVIVGSGVNQDGHTAGSIMSPSGEAQRVLMEEVYESVGLDPGQTQYVEAHGTGTKVGDKEEVSSIYSVFCEGRKRARNLYVGSVKSNIGHLEASAGIAGLIKSLLVLKSGVIPPQLNLIEPKASLKLGERNITIPLEPTPLSPGPQRVSLNSFGYGGTNCHIIIESLDSYQTSGSMPLTGPPKLVEKQALRGVNGNILTVNTNGVGSSEAALADTQLYLLSANSEKALKASARDVLAWLSRHSSTNDDPCQQRAVLNDLAHTLAARRTLLPWRSSIIASDVRQLSSMLESIRPTKASHTPRVAFIFTGQGAQWAGMGRELMFLQPFKDSILKSESVLVGLGASTRGWSLQEQIFSECPSRLGEAEIAQPATTCLQIALVDLLSSLGVHPTAVVGHSSGEIGAAYAAGALSHSAAIELSYYRGLCSSQGKQDHQGTPGSMLAVGLGKAAVQPYMANIKTGRLSVACVNSPQSTTISGDECAIDELKSVLDVDSIFARKLRVDQAYHSHHMQKIAPAYHSACEQTPYNSTRDDISFFSTVTGAKKCDDFGASYWVDNLVSPVQFVKGMQLVRDELKQGNPGRNDGYVLVEIGPAAALSGPTKQTLASSTDFKYTYLSPLARQTDGLQSALGFVGRLIELGVPLNRKKLSSLLCSDSSYTPKTLTSLKAYPFADDSSSFWRESRFSAAQRFRQFPWNDLCGLLDPACSVQEPRWRHFLNMDSLPWLKDHVIDGSTIFPASGYMAMVVEATKQLIQMRKGKSFTTNTSGSIKQFMFKDVKFIKAISFPVDEQDAVVELQLTISPSREVGGRWLAFRIMMFGNDTWEENCNGLISFENDGDLTEVDRVGERDLKQAASLAVFRDVQQACASCNDIVEKSTFYQQLEMKGNQYGSSFALLDDLHIDSTGTMACTKLTVPDLSELMPGHVPQPHLVHPTTLDAISHIGAQLFQIFNGNAPVVIGSVAEMAITATDCGDLWAPGTELFIAAILDRRLTDALSCVTDAYVFRKDTVTGEFSLALQSQYVLRSYGSGRQSLQEQGSGQDKQPRQITWGIDVDFLRSENFLEIVSRKQPRTLEAEGPEETFDRDYQCIEQAAYIFMRHALCKLNTTFNTSGTVTPPSMTEPHLEKLFNWMQKCSTSVEFHTLTADLSFEDEARIVLAAENASSLCFEGKTVARIGRKLADILLGKCDPTALIHEANLPNDLYTNSAFSPTYSHMAEYLRLLAFKKPHMKILEIGAGTGGATTPLLRALMGEDGSIWLDRYAYTDKSDDFFDQAKSKLTEWLGYIDFGVLDIETDPIEQGFEAQSYDVVIVANVVLSTKEMDTTLANARKLLRPEGKLIIAAVTMPIVAVDLVFGVLPSWRADGDKHYLLTTNEWDDLLCRHGFTGLDICTQSNHSSKHGCSSLIVSSTVTELDTLRQSTPLSPSSPLDGMRIVQGYKESHYVREITSTLLHASECTDRLGWTCSESIEDVAAMEPWKDKGPVIVLDVAEHSLLLNEKPAIFNAMRRLLTSGFSVIWVSLQETKTEAAVTATRCMIQGAARVLRRENGSTSRLITFDIDETADLRDGGVVRHVCSRILEAAQSSLSTGEDNYERELRYSGGELLIPRLQTDTKFQSWADRVCVGTSSKTASLESDVPYHQHDRPLKLEVGTPGLLSSLRFVDDPASSFEVPLQPREIQISTRAHGVNFKDVFVALGQMRAGVSMVGEVSGIVTAVGEDMTNRYKIGDSVFGFGASPFASQPRISGDLAHALPSGMSFQAGATIPVVYATAYYSLFKAANFRRGQTILIAAASGGVGQAAIQLAQYAGASKIFVTVGSKAKKQLVMDTYGIPESHVFSSRGTAFKDGIIRLTEGCGVDCVLNSLSGEMLSGAFDCLAKLGSFVEIGKTDIYKNSHIEMSNFDKSITFACVDLVVLGNEQPELVHETLSSVTALLEKGLIRPPSPVNALAIGRIEDAFRLIGTRKHTGKVVLESPPDSAVTATTAPAKPLKLSRDGTYVVAGGLGDLGRRLAAFMSAHEAGHVVLLSRRSITVEEHQTLQDRCGNLCAVHVVKCDITRESDLQQCVEFCRQKSLPPVRGVVHAGMVLRDRPFAAMSGEDFAAALGPKVFGTVNLDRAFSSGHLEFFITLSSVANHIGNGSQANYAAANEFQDAFARAHGLGGKGNTHYISIDLGAVAGSDAVSKLSSSNRLESVMVSLDDVFRSIRYAMSPQSKLDRCNQSILGLSRQGLTDADDYVCLTNPLFSQLPYPEQLNSDESGLTSSEKSTDIDKALRHVSTMNEAETLIQETIAAKCAVFLDRAIDDVPVNQPLAMIGLDSLVSIELKNWLLRALQATVQTSDISSASSINALASLVTKKSKLVSDDVRAATEEPVQAANGTFAASVSQQTSARATDTELPSHGFDCCRAVKELPKYPLIDLEETMSYLEKNVSHFAQNGEELRSLQQAVRDFTAPGSLGRQLHAQLRERASNPDLDSWLADLHLKGLYLSRRHPLAPWGNFLNTHYDSPVPHRQAERAALISTIAFQFQKEVSARVLSQDWLGSRALCTYSWDWIFNTVREPRVGCDEMQRYPGNDYCAVLRQGHLFTLPLRFEEEDVSYERLRDAFQGILDHVDLGQESWAGILTTDWRDPWAANRDALISLSESNKEYIQAIERAAFVVCLDDGRPVTNEERVRQCYVGSGFNRWHDKATQFLISANGRSAQLSEHSMVDGLTIARLTERIHDAIQSHVPTALGVAKTSPVPATRFTLQTTPEIEAQMSELRTIYASETAKKKYTLHTVPSLGINATLGTGLSAKACMDMAIQLANRIHFGHNPGSWEPVSTQHFHRGRPELVQVVTDSVVEFCEAALDMRVGNMDTDKGKGKKKGLLIKAAAQWEEQIRRAGEGRGFLRMWDTMGGMLPEGEGVEKPAIFTDPVFWRAFPGRVLQVRNEAEVEDAALCLYEEDALWMSYAIREDKVNISITGGIKKVDAYCEALNRAAEIIRSVI
ncbi:hypothetical protein N8I77_000008 [Diaporthe amygdali]|uniref:Uncharacterized protein n=1 Tax=Phomopsis amygdali TaxID=1214568 RepID=A0AAD9SNP9_PHOAM|nr:hypothetical protein N8I77_000008 [Diaporthe amygdali]